MRETSIMDNLNRIMQAHARVCNENNIYSITIRRKNDTYLNNFVVAGVSLKDHIGRIGG